jgi:hypothetical protein
VIHLLPHIAAKFEETGADVALQFTRTKHFSYRTMYLSAPYLKLKEAVASGAVALGEEKIVFVAGINVVDTPGVAVNLHRVLKAF